MSAFFAPFSRTLVASVAVVLSCSAGMALAAPRVQATAAHPAPVAKAKRSEQKQVSDYLVAVVNGAPITNYEVNLLADKTARQNSAQSATQRTRADLLAQALDTLILQKAAIESVRASGITVTEEEIDEAEKQLASQYKLSPQEFRQRAMKELRMDEKKYRTDMTDQLLLRKMREMRAAVAKEQVTDGDAMQWVREQKAQALQVVENHARHILLLGGNMNAQQAIAKLADVRKRIVAGQLDFAKAASDMSQDGSARQGGDLGWVPTGNFVPEFEEQLDALQPGQLSQPFVSRYGVHLVQLLDRRSRPMSPEQQLYTARQILGEQKAAQALAMWQDEIRTQAYIEMREEPR